jgi:hypothetical protein
MDPGGVRGNYPHEWGRPAVRPRLRWVVEHMPLEEAGFSEGAGEGVFSR